MHQWLCQCFPCFSSSAPLQLISSSAKVLGGDGHSGVLQWKGVEMPYPTFSLSGNALETEESKDQLQQPSLVLSACRDLVTLHSPVGRWE